MEDTIERGCNPIRIEGRHLIYNCPNGHINRKRKDYIKSSKFMCEECKIYDLHSLFKLRGFKLLESRFKGTHTSVKYKCPQGHYNYIVPSCFKQGDGCPDCAGNKKIDFQTILDKFNELEYTLLIEEEDYVHSKTKFNFICNKGHYTETAWDYIRSGRRCKECFVNKRLTYDYVKQEFAKHNYTLLSTDYVNSFEKLRIKCDFDHETEISYNKFQTGRRCRLCKHKSEQKCREIFEDYFGIQFPSIWPGWLNGMELDGYCEELSIAFEYNGKQHYEHVPFFHSGERALESQQQRDKLKLELCRKNKVELFIIPYTINFEELEYYIIDLIENKERISSQCREAAKLAKQKEVYKFNSKTLELIKIYESLEIASQEENIPPTTMRRVSKERNIKNGFIFSRTFELGEVYELKQSTVKKRVRKGGKVYESIREAARQENIKPSTLRYWVKHGKNGWKINNFPSSSMHF